MEIEMKAKLNDEQLDKILWAIDGESEYLEKRDEYFSFDGIAPKKPKDIIRIRKEKVGYAFKCLSFFGGDACGCNVNNIKNILAGNAHPFANVTPDKEQTWLTVKAKSTDPYGIESNREAEGPLGMGAEEAFRKSMKITHFDTYFTKFKRSFSFYVRNKDEDKNDFIMHAELVSVDGIGPYLEIESTVKLENEDADVLDGADLFKRNTARDQIKWYFKYELGITEFDDRSWVDILAEYDESEIKAK